MQNSGTAFQTSQASQACLVEALRIVESRQRMRMLTRMTLAVASVKSTAPTRRQMPPLCQVTHSGLPSSCAAPCTSSSGLKGPPDGHNEANNSANVPAVADNAADDTTDSRDLPVTMPLGRVALKAEP